MAIRIETIPAFCISLERSPDRWKQFQNQQALDHLPKLKRFVAVDGKTINIKTDPRIPLITRRNILATMRRSHEELNTQGGIGCALSHIGIWKWLANSDEEYVMIFEDDAQIPADFVERINHFFEKLYKHQSITADWDIIQFTNQSVGKKLIMPGVYEIDAFMGLQCYIITKKCATEFVAHAYPVHLHIDLWIDVYKSVYGLKILSPTNITVLQSGAKTNVQNNNPCKICDVPIDFEQTHSLITHNELFIIRSIELTLLVIFGYYAVKTAWGWGGKS